jgi:hypothetical protein
MAGGATITTGDGGRQRDPTDRRKVIVRIRHEAIEPVKAVYMVTQRRMFALWSTYSARDAAVDAT